VGASALTVAASFVGELTLGVYPQLGLARVIGFIGEVADKSNNALAADRSRRRLCAITSRINLVPRQPAGNDGRSGD
jgi:hypothetical protein